MAAALTPALWAGTAEAAPPITCVGNQLTKYSPGLKALVPQTVTYTSTGSYGSCPVNDGVTSVSYSEGSTVPNATCVTFPSTATATLVWRLVGGGTQQSSVEVTGIDISAVGATQVYTSVGTVQSGRYVGHIVNVTVAIVPDPTNLTPCLTSAGLTKLDGVSTLTIV
ncbi:hypothetical protein KBY55_36030 [Streptomyces sp. b94]|uniref:hypothetical protein n=1 Tax=Streptomyces sp. b94 TaxID=1827634 RepID=UPI001B36877F|nr:hypothetical protein [Streptomyces sp. b94]MBQ1101294.1 hypothetical protein [Streptomyces sp. b94]